MAQRGRPRKAQSMPTGPIRTSVATGDESQPDMQPVIGATAEEPEYVYTGADGTKHHTDLPKPPVRRRPDPRDAASRVQEIATRIAQEQAEADRDRLLAYRAHKQGKRYYREDGTEVLPFAAFQDAPLPDVSYCEHVKPGWEARYVRWEEGPDNSKDGRRIELFKREGYQVVKDPETKKDIEGFGGVLMQAPIEAVAKRTAERMPFGAANPRSQLEKFQQAADAANKGLAAPAVRLWEGSRTTSRVQPVDLETGE